MPFIAFTALKLFMNQYAVYYPGSFYRKGLAITTRKKNCCKGFQSLIKSFCNY